MTLLDAHLEQISACALSISEIPFPSSKIFTNALLQSHDITTLIRDTEQHERALFSVPQPPLPAKAHDPSTGANRRSTVFGANAVSNTVGGGPNAMRAPRRNTAVAAVLGTELVERIKRGGGGGVGTGMRYRGFESRERQDIDVETLLEGAEKLCGVYPIAGAAEKIMALRQRHQRLIVSVEHYEYKVAEQNEQLKQLNKPREFDDKEASDDPIDEPAPLPEELPMTEEDLRREEEEIKELERKKRGLEDRVNSMGKDISGVLR